MPSDTPSGLVGAMGGRVLVAGGRWDREKIVTPLYPAPTGVRLSELPPEQSTDAIVPHHQEAKYFNT